MDLKPKRFAAHLGDTARGALEACRNYPSAQVMYNPLTRLLAQRIANAEWRATLKQIDFPYRLDEVALGGRNCLRYRTSRSDPANPLILYIHAGAFVAGSPRVNAAAVLPACELSGCEAVGVHYSLAPDAVFPTQLEEIEAVYRAILDSGRPASRIVVYGDSAGGTLALASMHRWRRAGLPAPAGVAVVSPLTDCAADSDTHVTLAGHDPIFGGHSAASTPLLSALYAPGRDPRDPAVSPLYDDYAQAAPLLIHVGSREVLLGDAARLAERARRAGADVTLRVFDGMFHLFHMHWRLDEARAVFEDFTSFIRRVAAADGARSAA